MNANVSRLKMVTVQAMIDKHGGLEVLKEKYIKIKNEPYMPLVIEWVGSGPNQTELVSVAHYYTQNGDAMRDPEIVFMVSKLGYWIPMTYQQDGLGLYQEAVIIDGETYRVNFALLKSLQSFARTWDRNIKEQGFLAAQAASHQT